ncbi:peptidase [Nitrosopumilus sp.]|uniref:peptidase n=1 Tax=Nitrosopumilus sp. TaxID=2024843 RepID=UPI0034A076A5
MKILDTIIIICVVFLFAPIPNVFGHGLGGEVLPPVLIGNKQASLSINITPSVYDDNSEKFISLRLSDSNSDAIIEHVTFEFELKKDGKQIFKDVFHDELGNLNIKTITDNSNNVTIEGIKEPILNGWMKNDSNSLILRGPIFTSGGLYEYTVKILSINSDDNILNDKIILNGAISIAQTNFFKISNSINEEKLLQVISYFDSIHNFNFKSNTIEFSMPFDWTQDLEQLSVVHQEIRIPNTFGDFLFTSYDSTVNGILLPDDSVTIDDYSFEDRTIHIVVSQDLIKQIRNEAMQISNTQMNFQLKPSENVKFPLEFTTPDLRYKVFLSWKPKTIHAEDEITFFIVLEELFSDKSKKLVEYDLSIIQKNSEIFSKHLVGNVNSEKPNSHTIMFNDNQTGTANFVLSNINGNSLSKGNFILVIKSNNILQNETSVIPSWIKSSAAQWITNQVPDFEFLKNITFLFDQGIISVEDKQHVIESEWQIPSWFKITTTWWYEEKISDDEFLYSIENLVKRKIILV